MKSLLGDFIAKLGWEDIFKPKIGNESLHKLYHKIYTSIIFKKKEKMVSFAQNKTKVLWHIIKKWGFSKI